LIEYVYNAIRATAGEDNYICAVITDDTGEAILDCYTHLMIYDDLSLIATVDGSCIDGVWEFYLSPSITSGLQGRYWYCICADNESLCFKQPIYFI
jgi:hypothetical protein